MFKGSIVAIVTPFHEDLTVNYSKLTDLLNWHVKQGTDGIVILGTTGEAPTLSEQEKLQVFEHTVTVINHRIPVIAGTGSNDTLKTIEFTQKVEALGVDGFLIVSPYYNKSNDQGLYHHFKMIADSVHKPIILYNVPGRTGINIPVSVVAELSKHDNIVAIKEASGNMSYAVEVASVVSPDFILLSGNDDVVVPLLSIGAQGVISVAANVIPKQMHDIVEAYLNNDIVQAKQLQLQYLKLINMLFIETNPIPVKEAMNIVGMNVGPFRMPLYPMSETNRAKLKATLEEYSL